MHCAVMQAAYAARFPGKDGAFSFAICGEETALNTFFIEFKAALTVRGGGRNGIRQGTVSDTREKIESFLTGNLK